MVVGSARDIVETCGVPRFLFVDYPLGNPCGRPWAREEQQGLFSQALTLLERAYGPRTTMQVAERWVEDPAADRHWRENFMAIRDRRALAEAGAARRAVGVTTLASASVAVLSRTAVRVLRALDACPVIEVPIIVSRLVLHVGRSRGCAG